MTTNHFTQPSTRRQFAGRCLSATAAAALGLWAADAARSAEGDRGRHRFQSFLGKRPPELKGKAEHWVNRKTALSLEKLRGRVVWLEFNF